jgi:hypothetical protein
VLDFNCRKCYFDQALDHFDQAEKRKFNQTYWVCDDAWPQDEKQQVRLLCLPAADLCLAALLFTLYAFKTAIASCLACVSNSYTVLVSPLSVETSHLTGFVHAHISTVHKLAVCTVQLHMSLAHSERLDSADAQVLPAMHLMK